MLRILAISAFFIASEAFLFPPMGGGGACCGAPPACPTPCAPIAAPVSCCSGSSGCSSSCGSGSSGCSSSSCGSYSSGSSYASSSYAAPQQSYASNQGSSGYAVSPQQSYQAGPGPAIGGYQAGPAIGGYQQQAGPQQGGQSYQAGPAIGGYQQQAGPQQGGQSYQQSSPAPQSGGTQEEYQENQPQIVNPSTPAPQPAVPTSSQAPADNENAYEEINDDHEEAPQKSENSNSRSGYKVKAHAAPSVNAEDADSKCNSEALKKIILENINEKPAVSKRQIQSKASEELGPRIDVICSTSVFSYLVNTEIYCEAEGKGVTCLAYRQVSE